MAGPQITDSFARNDNQVLVTTNKNYAQGVKVSGSSAPDVILFDTDPPFVGSGDPPNDFQITAELDHGANTNPLPTAQLGGTNTKTIARDAGIALAVGDTGGSGNSIQLKFSSALDKYILLNPSLAKTANIEDGAATNPKLADMGDGTIKGRPAGAGTGPPSDLISSQVATILTNQIGQTQLQTDSVGQGELKTSSGTNNFSFLVGVFGLDAQTLPGGQHGFWPRTEITTSSLPAGEFGEFVLAASTNSSTIVLDSILTLYKEQSAGFLTGESAQTFVSASPPFNMGDGDISNFTFLRFDKDNNLTGSYVAEVPPWAYNGPTSIRPDKIEEIFGSNGEKTGIRKLKKVPKKIVLPPWENGNRDEWIEWINNKEYEFVEIDHAIKNNDMEIHPHPFKTLRDGDYIVLVEPACDFMDKIQELHDEGENIHKMFLNGYITLGEEIDCAKPNGVIVKRPKWK